MPRATRFTFAGGDLSGLAYAASEQGFDATPTADGEGLVLATEAIVDELRYADFDDLMHGWAGEFGADYLGWEADPPTF